MIVPTLARLIVREHIYRPITGRVLTLGRQTIAMNYEQMLELFKQENFSPKQEDLRRIERKLDNSTRMGKKTNFITDEVFFGLLGISQFNVMDVSKYEGADILHNLNEPVSGALVGAFDFIIDGGTFDHLLDLRTAFENVVKMLKPDGRIFQWNAASNFTGAAYISLGPDFFYDYYTLNKFKDCQVYLAAVDTFGQKELWDLYEFSGEKEYGHFYSKRILMTVVMAEKAADSTYNKIPIQAQYRDDPLIQIYKDNQKIIALSKRARYSGSRRGIKLSRANSRFSVSRSIVNKAVARCRENGVGWVVKKSVSKLPLSKNISNKGAPGFKYIGKI